MARFSRLEVLNSVIDTGVVPIFYEDDPDVARQIVAACAAGGARAVEFTNRGDQAYQRFGELVRHFAEAGTGVILGAGTVVDAPTAALYLACGANFVVGPNLNPEVARLCNRRKVAYLPGCGSVNEVSAAEELGVEICKLFPGNEVGGPSFLKALLAPMPWSRIMPTGELEATEESVSGWIKAGASCVGIGADLVRKDLVASGDYQAISARVAQVISWVRKARGESVFGPIEHVGVYPQEGATGEGIAEWYRRAFGYTITPGRNAFFAGNEIFGRIEAMPEPVGEKCHIAVRVWDFEAAVEDLTARGYELGTPRIGPTSKLIYLKDRDPGGNLVHIVWRA